MSSYYLRGSTCSILVVLLLVFSCKKFGDSPAVAFEEGVVSFTCPAGWSIEEEDDLGGEGYYLAVEKNGFDSSGIMTINWFYNEIAPKDLVNSYQKDMTANSTYKDSDLVFSDLFKVKSEYYNVTSSRYTFSFVGTKHFGIISAFNYGGNTFLINKQGAVEDKDENRKGFELIENSFKLKKVD